MELDLCPSADSVPASKLGFWIGHSTRMPCHLISILEIRMHIETIWSHLAFIYASKLQHWINLNHRSSLYVLTRVTTKFHCGMEKCLRNFWWIHEVRSTKLKSNNLSVWYCHNHPAMFENENKTRNLTPCNLCIKTFLSMVGQLANASGSCRAMPPERRSNFPTFLYYFCLPENQLMHIILMYRVWSLHSLLVLSQITLLDQRLLVVYSP